MGEGGVKKSGKMSDIIYGCPLSCLLVAVASFGEPMLLVSAALRRLTECKANHYRRRSHGGEAWRQWPPLLYLLLLLRQSRSLVRFRRQAAAAAATATDTPAPRLVRIVRH